MSTSPRWGYVQARLQARHGRRLDEAGWRAIESVRSLDQFIARTGATPLARFTEVVHAHMSVHYAERMLREAWRAYVAELAEWVTPPWREAVLWTAHVPDLPIIDAALHGETPAWIGDDPAFATLVQAGQQSGSPRRSLDPLAALKDGEEMPAARWYAHWRSLWPRRGADDHALIDLVALVRAQIERIDRAGLRETSGPYRTELARQLARMFRRQAGRPAAVFCHLGLVALDLERLRGDLVRRHLFESGEARHAA